VVWPQEVIEHEEVGRLVTYQLLQRLSPTEYRVYYPSCEGGDAEIATAAGAEPVAGAVIPTCRFATRAALESAIRRLEPRPDRSIRLTRLSDGAR
jgi:hypothetical protein